jgi:hypothetical protein
MTSRFGILATLSKGPFTLAKIFAISGAIFLLMDVNE